MKTTQHSFRLALVLAAAFAATSVIPASAFGGAPAVYHKTTKIDGLDIFYREAGPKDAPTVLLLHGFPTSSHMFRNLIPALADRYHFASKPGTSTALSIFFRAGQKPRLPQ